MFARTGSAGTEGDNPSSQQVITKAMGVRVPPGRRAKKEAIKEEIAKEEIETIGKKVSEKPYSPATKNSPTTKRPEEPGAEGDKLESIKITAPGTYELNLPSLFEREELIMAVKEGTYFIDLSSAFRKGKKE